MLYDYSGAVARSLYSRLHDAVICVYDKAGKVIETHEQTEDFKEP
jgi:hypothetical protein